MRGGWLHPSPHRFEQPIGAQDPGPERLPVGLFVRRTPSAMSSSVAARNSLRDMTGPGGSRWPSMPAASFVPFPRSARATHSRMERAGSPRLAWGVVGLLPGAVLLGVVALLAASPPLDVADAGLGWVEPVLASVLLVGATLAALARLVDGLRTRRVRQLLEVGAGLPSPIGRGRSRRRSIDRGPGGGSVGMLAAAALTRDTIVIRDTATTRLAAVAVLVLAESLVLIVLVPAASAWLAPYAKLGLGRRHRPCRRRPRSRSGAPGTERGIARSWGSRVAGGPRWLGRGPHRHRGARACGARRTASAAGRQGCGGTLQELADERLPELAAQLPEAVLRFDGGLALREWNDPRGLPAGARRGRSGCGPRTCWG